MHDARIINLSLAGPADRLLQALLDAAAARGTTVVGAVNPERPTAVFPASSASVLAVAAETSGPPTSRAEASYPARPMPQRTLPDWLPCSPNCGRTQVLSS
jgi:subtilisin family serine protease